MPETDARKRATARYRKKVGVKQVNLKFFPKDFDLYEWLQSQPRITEYVLRLIREDMERTKGQH